MSIARNLQLLERAKQAGHKIVIERGVWSVPHSLVAEVGYQFAVVDEAAFSGRG